MVAIEMDPGAMVWMEDHPAGPRVIPVVGDASDEAVAGRAADLAEEAGTLSGWVNNAAVFRDASLHSAPAREVMDLIALNLGLAWSDARSRSGVFWRRGGAGLLSTSPLTRRNGRSPAPCHTLRPRRPPKG